MSSQADEARHFLARHQGEMPLLLPNARDAGSAKLLASLGFEALATTSSGYAATLGQLDGSVTRAQALDHAATIVDATELPVSADLENAFAHDPEGVAKTIALAREADTRRARAAPARRVRRSGSAGAGVSRASRGHRRRRRSSLPARAT